MKLSNILLFIGAVAASYKLVENRQKIREEVTETADILITKIGRASCRERV